MVAKLLSLIGSLFGRTPPASVKGAVSDIEAAAQLVSRDQRDLRKRAEDLGIGVASVDSRPKRPRSKGVS